MFALRQRILSSATSRLVFYSNLVQTNRRTISATFDHNQHSPMEDPYFFSQTSPKIGNSRIERVAPAISVPSSAVSSMAFGVVSDWFVMSNPWNLMTKSLWEEGGFFRISTLKRRRKMMNKHKLRKRRKKNRMKNKK